MKNRLLFGFLWVFGLILITMTFLMSILSINKPVYAGKCGGIETSIVNCNTEDSKEAIFSVLGLVISIFTYGVGIAATVGLVFAGYQYMISKSDPSVIVKVKTRVLHIVIGVLMYFLFWTAINFLLPGGVFSK